MCGLVGVVCVHATWVKSLWWVDAQSCACGGEGCGGVGSGL